MMRELRHDELREGMRVEKFGGDGWYPGTMVKITYNGQESLQFMPDGGQFAPSPTWPDSRFMEIDVAQENEESAAMEEENDKEEASKAIVAWAKQSYEPVSSDDGEMADMKRQGLLSGVRVDLISIEPQDDMWKARLAIAGGRFDVIVTFWLDDVHKLEEKRLHIEDVQQEEPGTDVPPRTVPSSAVLLATSARTIQPPSLEDEALQASLLTVGVMGLINQLYTDGKFDLDTHNLLYEKAREADAQVRFLMRAIETTEQERREQ